MLTASLRRLWLRPERSTAALYALLLASALLSSSLLLSRPLRYRLLRVHQAQPASLLEWTVFQLQPKMYTGAHRVLFADQPSFDFLRVLEQPDFWINHSPARLARFETIRSDFLKAGQPQYLLMNSRYRDSELASVLEIRPSGSFLHIETWDAR